MNQDPVAKMRRYVRGVVAFALLVSGIVVGIIIGNARFATPSPDHCSAARAYVATLPGTWSARDAQFVLDNASCLDAQAIASAHRVLEPPSSPTLPPQPQVSAALKQLHDQNLEICKKRLPDGFIEGKTDSEILDLCVHAR